MWFGVVRFVGCRLEKVLDVGRWIDFVDFEVEVVNVPHIDIVVHALTVNIVCPLGISATEYKTHGRLTCNPTAFLFFLHRLFLLICHFVPTLCPFCIGVFRDDGG